MSVVRAVRRFYWRSIRRYAWELCRCCGGRVGKTCGGTYWLCDDDLWDRVHGDPSGISCLPCFVSECGESGIAIHWRAVEDVIQ